MQFIGPPFTFGFKQIGSNCGAVGIHSAVDVSGTSFWMSDESFFMFDGSVKKIPCSVQDHVFDNINQNAKQDVFCAANADFNEVMWFYPSSGSDLIDRVVIYNYAENLWYVGSLARTSWVDRGVYQYPMATDSNLVYNHEKGNDNDGTAFTSFIESSPIDVQDGDQFVFIRRMIPDVSFEKSMMTVSYDESKTDGNKILNLFAGDPKYKVSAYSETGDGKSTKPCASSSNCEKLVMIVGVKAGPFLVGPMTAAPIS